jgi:hypothetical protein
VIAPRGGAAESNAVESLLGMLVVEVEQRARRQPLLLVLDGCAAVGSMPRLSRHLADRAGAITVLATLTDIEDCAARTGSEMSELAESARAVVLLGGGGDSSPADLMHHLVRRQLAPRRLGAGLPTERDEARPDLLPPEAARHLGPGRALLVHDRMAPTVLWLRNCYEDADLQPRLRENPYVRGVTHIAVG